MMQLRNKKTGEIIEGEYFTDIVKKLHERGDVLCYGSLLNVDLFSEYWEEIDSCEPKEPLIKDEKIRQCVKLWTELNGYGRSLMYAEGDNWGDNWCSFYEPLDGEELLFRKHKCTNLQNEKVYTIAELCGEEEE